MTRRRACADRALVGLITGDLGSTAAGDYTVCRAEPSGEWLHHPDRYRDVLLATAGGDPQRVVLGALVEPDEPAGGCCSTGAGGGAAAGSLVLALVVLKVALFRRVVR